MTVQVSNMFRRFNDVEYLRRLYQEHLPGIADASWKITDCRMIDSKFKTYLKPESVGKSTLSICHQLALKNMETGCDADLIVYAKVFQEGRSRDEYLKQRNRHWVTPQLGQALTHILDQDLLAWTFPNDPGLPQLPSLMNTERAIAFFPSTLWNSDESQCPGTIKLTSRVINYRPEVRCMIRYEWENSENQLPKILFGKTFHDGHGKELYRRMKYFWDRSLRKPSGMLVAEPLGYADSINTLWQRGIPGDPLIDVLDDNSYAHLLSSVAGGLASLHTSAISELGTSTVQQHLHEVHKKVAKLSHGFPAFSTQFHSLARHLEESAPYSRKIPICSIYWDFHVNQLLAYQDQVFFFDLDELVMGDPLQDVANFMVDLNFRNLDPSFFQRLIVAFYDAYQQQVDWDVCVPRLNWHASIQFLNKIYRHYIQQSSDLREIIPSTLKLIEAGIIPLTTTSWRCTT